MVREGSAPIRHGRRESGGGRWFSMTTVSVVSWATGWGPARRVALASPLARLQIDAAKTATGVDGFIGDFLVAEV